MGTVAWNRDCTVHSALRTPWPRSAKSALKYQKKGYNCNMFLAILGMRILVGMFFLGLLGSSVVVLISFIEDGKELFGKD
jgi:hypothetical protein